MIKLNLNRIFNESNIGGHDYLRNLVHLPFYLQNSGLRKVKTAQEAALALKRRDPTIGRSSVLNWLDTDEPNQLNQLNQSNRTVTEMFKQKDGGSWTRLDSGSNRSFGAIPWNQVNWITLTGPKTLTSTQQHLR